jgi:hypothetical protein
LYILKGDEPPEKIEVNPGLRCILEDISDTGCALTIGGRAPAGLRVKIQFAIEGDLISMPGVVRSSDYSEETNRSLLHIEADTLTLTMRNRILALVFGVNANDDPGDDFFRFDEPSAYSAGTDSATPAQDDDSIAAAELLPVEDEDASELIEETDFDAQDPSAGHRGPVEDAGGKV